MQQRNLAQTGFLGIWLLSLLVVGPAACSQASAPQGSASLYSRAAPKLLSTGSTLTLDGCQCTGTEPGNVGVTVACGQSICGTDFNRWTCDAAGWSGPGQTCSP